MRHLYPILVVAGLSCACGSSTEPGTPPDIPVAPEVSEGEPQAVADPAAIDFGDVSLGAAAEQLLTVRSVGGPAVLVEGFTFQGDPGFGLQLDPGNWPVLIPAGKAFSFSLAYQPQTIGAASGIGAFQTSAGELVVAISATAVAPCIQANPKKLQFGGKLVGESAMLPLEIIACGDGPLTLSGVVIVTGDGGQCAGHGCERFHLEAVEPVAIPAGAQVAANVTYAPAAEAELSPDGQLLLDQATVRITALGVDEPLDVPVSGLGVVPGGATPD